MNEDAVWLWIRKAESDLKIGRGELTTEAPATDAICFHMQQCAEKYLKVYLIFHGQEYPRTHDIDFILSECARINPRFQSLIEQGVSGLTKYATGVRYEEETFPSLEETTQALMKAEIVKDFVLRGLAEKGFEL